MAAAYLDHLAGDRYEAQSAGTAPADRPHAEAVAAMAEVSVDIPEIPGSLLTAEVIAAADRVVALGDVALDSFEVAVPVEKWGIPDPAGRPLPEVRVMRDTIRRLIERLVARLDTEAVVR